MKKIILTCWFSVIMLLSMSGQELTSSSQVSILTCGPGQELYALFGHTAIRVWDPAQRIDKVYNYGLFDYSKPNFMFDFVRGETQYMLGATTYGRFLREYEYYKRYVYEQILDLDLDKRNEFYQFLENNLKPENREYLYNFFYDNCSSRVKEGIEDHLPDFTYQDVPSRAVTYRQLLDEYTIGREWTDFGIDLIIGEPGDSIANHEAQMFLPEYVMAHLRRLKSPDGRSVVKHEQSVLIFDRIKGESWWVTPKLVFSILLLLEFLMFIFPKSFHRKFVKVYDLSWFVVVSLASLLLLFMWTTKHNACHDNWNLLWLSPLFIPFSILQFSKTGDWNRRVGISVLGMLILTLLFWSWWPQRLPETAILIIGLLFFKVLRNSLRKTIDIRDYLQR
ncbi:MAG: DUF4105 domain-containing protein [Bacteroidia bacterium]|nr:DUF4105 domain-containing protein [Bacteroidia bacterium]